MRKRPWSQSSVWQVLGEKSVEENRWRSGGRCRLVCLKYVWWGRRFSLMFVTLWGAAPLCNMTQYIRLPLAHPNISNQGESIGGKSKLFQQLFSWAGKIANLSVWSTRFRIQFIGNVALPYGRVYLGFSMKVRKDHLSITSLRVRNGP